MGLIKSNVAPASLQPFSMRDVETAARSLLLRARRQAEELIAAAQGEAESMKELARAEGASAGVEQGRLEGIEQGRAAGHQRALQEHGQALTEAAAALAGAAGEIEAHRLELKTDGLREVVRLAAAIARRVTKRQGLIDEDVLLANVADAMRLVVHAADVRIALHPTQVQTLRDALPQLAVELPAFQHAQIVEDATLAPGGCRLFTRGGQVDADLDGQLDRVIAELLPEGDEGVTG